MLLKGVNDDPDTLEELFRRLQSIRVRPYYAFCGDPVNGTLSDTFVVPEGKTPTAKEVADAVVEVGKDEANNFLAKIKAFFQNLLESLKKIFSFGK